MAKRKTGDRITEAVNRIKRMEKSLDKVLEAVSQLENITDAAASQECLSAIEKDVAKLRKYYEGKHWKADFELDEKGLLPEGLKRGVLSEDGIYNALDRYEELLDEQDTDED